MTEPISILTKQFRGCGFMTIAKYNNKGDLIYIGDKESKNISVVETSNYTIIGTFDGHNGVIWSLDLTTDDKIMVSCSGDMNIIIWNTLNGEIIKQYTERGIPKFISIQKNMSTNYAIILCESISKRFKTYIIIYDLDNINENIYCEEWEESSKPTIILWLDQSKFLIGTDSGVIYIRDMLDKNFNKDYKIHEGAIKSIVFNKARTNILTSSLDTTSKQINLENWEVLKTFTSTVPINYAIFNYNDRKVMLAGGIEAMLISKTTNSDLNIKFYRTGDLKLTSHMSSHFGPVRYMDRSPKDQNFITASQDGTVKIYLIDKNTENNNFKYELFGSIINEDVENLKLKEEKNTIEYINNKVKIISDKPEPKRIIGMPPLKNNNNNNNNNESFKINKDNELYDINQYKPIEYNTTIRVSNLPYDIDYKTLYYYFEYYGRIEEKGIRIKSYSDNTMAFIKYLKLEDAKNAIEYMNRKPIENYIINVEFTK